MKKINKFLNHFKMQFKSYFSFRHKGFSLVEIMVSIILISAIAAAFTPIITKKILNNNKVLVKDTVRISTNCTGSRISTTCQSGLTCILCDLNARRCLKVMGTCPASEKIDNETCACTACKVNNCEHCNVNNDNICDECKIGFCRNSTGSQCVEIVAGKYCSGTSLANCPAGYYCPLHNIGPIVCPDGHWSNAGSATCGNCGKGYACKNGTKTTCENGKYSNSDTAADCSTCPAGTYSGAGAQTGCTNCPDGHWSNAGSATCGNCGKGYACKNAAKTTCENGKYSNSDTAADCSTCADGTYSGPGPQTGCTNCGPGKYSKAGSSRCSNCPGGTYCSGQTCSSCTNCGAGNYSAADLKSCLPCENGKYCSSQACSTCASCSISGCNTFSKTACACTSCKAGFRLENSSCTKCDIGYYASAGATSCTSCGSCKTTLDKGSTSSSACKCAVRDYFVNNLSRVNPACAEMGNGTCTNRPDGWIHIKKGLLLLNTEAGNTQYGKNSSGNVSNLYENVTPRQSDTSSDYCDITKNKNCIWWRADYESGKNASGKTMEDDYYGGAKRVLSTWNACNLACNNSLARDSRVTGLRLPTTTEWSSYVGGIVVTAIGNISRPCWPNASDGYHACNNSGDAYYYFSTTVTATNFFPGTVWLAGGSDDSRNFGRWDTAAINQRKYYYPLACRCVATW